MKDNFSSQSDQYARYRPLYPPEFFEYLNSIVPNKNDAWDCGTGNGQVAIELAKTFHHVHATDISQSQIDNALRAENITYSVQSAESANFENGRFDLVVVAQAIHWFDFERFYSEVRRTAKEDALLCVVGYNRPKISEETDQLITSFYTNVIGRYWDKERRYIDEEYKTIPFPFGEIQSPQFSNKLQWTFEHLAGYLNTWSAVKHFIKQNNYNPVDQLQEELERYWGSGQTREVTFPLLLRIGRITR
jgi:SAM-dependent methyltransferase